MLQTRRKVERPLLYSTNVLTISSWLMIISRSIPSWYIEFCFEDDPKRKATENDFDLRVCWQDLETQSKQRGNRSGPAAHLESTIVRERILSRHLFLFSETWLAYFLRCLEKECTHWKPPRYKFISTVGQNLNLTFSRALEKSSRWWVISRLIKILSCDCFCDCLLTALPLRCFKSCARWVIRRSTSDL